MLDREPSQSFRCYVVNDFVAISRACGALVARKNGQSAFLVYVIATPLLLASTVAIGGDIVYAAVEVGMRRIFLVGFGDGEHLKQSERTRGLSYSLEVRQPRRQHIPLLGPLDRDGRILLG